MNSPHHTPIERIISSALREGDKNPGDLLDLAGCTYPELFSALKSLSGKRQIEYYFSGEPSAIVYRLCNQPIWMRRN